MAAQGLRPGRIRNSMPRKFNVPMDDLPELKVVQNFSNYFRKTKMMNNDFVDELTEYIRGLEFNGNEEDSAPFTISWQKDDAGHIEVGTGSDEKPFVVGVTLKRLLARLDRPVDSFVFHVDATFKVTQVEYPVLVCGMSDRCRSFHLVALFVTFQRLEPQYTDMLNALRSVYFRVMQKPLKVHYVMGDAEEAQCNAIQSTFGSDNVLKVSMCFYHVVANVLKRTKSMEPYHASKVIRDIYDMHFSRNAYECATLARSRVAEWKASPPTKYFGVYFENQWLKGKFVRWQCFQTPPGFASTNNPVEQFNKKLKRDYTLRQKLKMGTLL